jgi:UDP:flavonoid glycosyltransferase YjiC (YdhE family)
MSVARPVYRTMLMAVQDVDARVLLTVGRQFEPSGLGPIPGNVHVEAWVDQAEIMNQADLVVCHGGSGTALGALAAGVPMVIVPVFADQFENGHRIAEAGAAILVTAGPGRRPGRESAGGLPDRKVIGLTDAPRITGGIEAVLGSPRYRRQAARISAEMAAAPPVDDVLVALLTGDLTRR